MEIMDMRAAARAIDKCSNLIARAHTQAERLISAQFSDPEFKGHLRKAYKSAKDQVRNSLIASIAIYENLPPIDYMIVHLDAYQELVAASARHDVRINQISPLLEKLKLVSEANPESASLAGQHPTPGSSH